MVSVAAQGEDIGVQRGTQADRALPATVKSGHPNQTSIAPSTILLSSDLGKELKSKDTFFFDTRGVAAEHKCHMCYLVWSLFCLFFHSHC